MCRGITRGQLQAAIEREGCNTIASLTQKLGAGAECGSCSAAMAELLGDPLAWTTVTATRRALSADTGADRRIEQVDLHLPEGADYPATHAGQHVTVQGLIDGRWVARSYTIINPSPRPRVISIAVRRVPSGRFTPWLLEDSSEPRLLRISPPGGNNYWSEPSAEVVCMVGGIGITLARSLLASRPSGTRLHLDCSTRTQTDDVFVPELDALGREDPTFSWTRRHDDVEGRITKAEVRDTVARFPGARFVLCGPPAYVGAVQGWLQGAGVAKGRIHVERFFLSETRPAVRRSWKTYGYRWGAALALLPALWLLPALEAMVPHHAHNPGHEKLACNDCHVSAPGTVRQQLQAKVDYALGRSEVDAAFMFKAVDNRVCQDCHQRSDDHHPSHRFLEPRFAEVRATFAPQLCISCHREHHEMRLTQTDTGFCAACHSELALARDPITPTHAALIQAQRWETCLGCHDFHNNHGWKAPTQLSAAISPVQIRDYFAKGPSPYGAVVEKASPKRPEPGPKP